MTTKNNLYGMMALFGALAMTGNMSTRRGREYEPEPSVPIKRPIPNGCQEFNINGDIIVAINRKSAEKKYAKRNQ